MFRYATLQGRIHLQIPSVELLGPSAVIEPLLVEEIVTPWKNACACCVKKRLKCIASQCLFG